VVNSYTIGLVEIKVQTSVWKLLTLLIIWSIISVHAQIFTSLGHAILFTCSAGGKQSKFFITLSFCGKHHTSFVTICRPREAYCRHCSKRSQVHTIEKVGC